MEKQELSYSDIGYILLESDITAMCDLIYCITARIKLKDFDSVFVYIGIAKCIVRHWKHAKLISKSQYKYIEVLIDSCFRNYNSGKYDACIERLNKIKFFVTGLI